MLFNTQAPGPSSHYVSPQYVQGDGKNFLMNLAGYKSTGQHNAWGKLVTAINPAAGIVGSTIAGAIAKNAGATDTSGNIGQELPRDFQKFISGAQIGANIAKGDIGGAVGSAAQGIGTVNAMPKPNLSDDAEISYYNKGGKMKKGEDVALVDKKTGGKVGEMSYNERIFSKDYTKKMDEFKKAKDYLGLGKFIAKEIDKQRKN